jgi:hypothetical protein
MNTPIIIRPSAKSVRANPASRDAQEPALTGPVEIGLVLDQSGSMSSYCAEVITGYNALLEEQKTLALETRVSLTLFDSRVHDLYQGKEIVTAPTLSLQTYQPSGGTALYDGIMASINGLAARVDSVPSPPRVVVAIFSDGEENASRHHNETDVKTAIVFRQTSGWKFLFLGPHASKTAYALGIPVSNALAITASRDGIRQALSRLKSALTNIRLGKSTDVFRLK